jgi:transitional endoplasmic reticulum ATPase
MSSRLLSAIFFEPPGTSKTQLANHIGRFLGWPVLSVDRSYLVQEGLDRIQALANRLFSMLTLTEQVVVLLDEFDEMGRDRSRAQELLSRFITTAVLPKLASINSERKLVFLLATNYIGGFDAAFSRGGRFDMLVQVMPPRCDVKLSNTDWRPMTSSRPIDDMTLNRFWPI